MVAAFAILEAADLVIPALPALAWIYPSLIIIVLAGLPVAAVLSWLFLVCP